MKVNQSTRNVNSETFSEFYKVLMGPIDKVLNSRPIHMDTLNTYLNVEETESSLSRFFRQNDKSVALLRGPQGTGKSSTIFYMHKRYLGNKTTSSVYFDLRQHEGRIIPSNFGDITDSTAKANALFPRIRDLLAARFSSLADTVIRDNGLSSVEENWKALSYAYKNHRQVIPQGLRPKLRDIDFESPDEEILRIASAELAKHYEFQSMFEFVRYAYLMQTKCNAKRISIFLDNIDQMAYPALEAAISCANTFSSCATGANVRNVTLGKIRFRFIISCRHHNYERLIERSHINALGANNHVPITHAGLPSLSKIVEKRLKRVERFGAYTFRRGMRLAEVDTKAAVKAYFRQLDDSGTYRQLLLLNNNNLSATFDTVREITQNKFFPTFDKFVENHQIGTRGVRSFYEPVNANIATSCLVWGNPSKINDALYPSQKNTIPNLLAWDGEDIMSFMLTLRIILLLKRLGAHSSSGRLISLALIYQKFSQCFPIESRVFLSAISEMSKQKLLVFYAEKEVPGINAYSSYKLSPKAEYLIEYGPRYEPVALGFLEDLFVAQPEDLLGSVPISVLA